INEIEIDYSGPQPVVTRFVATFTQYCEGLSPALRGAIYFNADAVPPDSIAPTTAFSIYRPFSFLPPAVVLDAIDNLGGSGTQATYYQRDGGPTQPYNGPFSAAEGMHSLVFWSADWAGNAEAANNQSFIFDSTPPVTSAFIAGPAGMNGWYSGPIV